MKKCAWCGKEFEPKHGVQKYCSDDCQKAKRLSRIYKRTCVVCGVGFEVKAGSAMYCPDCKKTVVKNKMAQAQALKGNKNRAFTATTNWQISIMDFRGQSIKEMANIFNRSIDSVQKQIKKLKENGAYDVIIKRYIQQQPSERKLLNKGA